MVFLIYTDPYGNEVGALLAGNSFFLLSLKRPVLLSSGGEIQRQILCDEERMSVHRTKSMGMIR